MPFTKLHKSSRLCALIAAAALGVMTPHAAAQTKQTKQPAAPASQNVPNAVQGFSTNKDLPVKIESIALEVRDKQKIATFLGDVVLTQGDTTLKCKTLIVYYDQENDGRGMQTAKPATPAAPGAPTAPTQQKIRRLEAKGGVLVTQKDQTATGDNGDFDLKTNTVVLSGNVMVAQAQNVIRGDRLIVNLTTGDSRVESGKTRVQGLFQPSSRDAKPDAKPDDKPAPSARPTPEAATPAPSRPLRLN